MKNILFLASIFGIKIVDQFPQTNFQSFNQQTNAQSFFPQNNNAQSFNAQTQSFNPQTNQELNFGSIPGLGGLIPNLGGISSGYGEPKPQKPSYQAPTKNGKFEKFNNFQAGVFRGKMIIQYSYKMFIYLSDILIYKRQYIIFPQPSPNFPINFVVSVCFKN